MKSILSWLLVPFAFVAAFAGVAFAQTATGGEDASILELAKPVLDAVLAGNPGLAAALALVLVAAAARRYGGARIPWLKTDAGGAAMVLVGAFGGAAASALYAGGGWSLSMAWAAFQIAAATSGGYSLVKRLLVDPILRPYVIARMPQWLRVPIELGLAWIFSRPDPVKRAETAGVAAVAAKPSAGVEGVVGKAREIE